MTRHKHRQITAEIFLSKKVRILHRNYLVAYVKFYILQPIIQFHMSV